MLIIITFVNCNNTVIVTHNKVAMQHSNSVEWAQLSCKDCNRNIHHTYKATSTCSCLAYMGLHLRHNYKSRACKQKSGSSPSSSLELIA